MSESLHLNGRPDARYGTSFAVCVGCVAKERGLRLQERKDKQAGDSASLVQAARRWVVQRLK